MLAQGYFLRMKFEQEPLSKKVLHGSKQILQIRPVRRYDDEVVRVSSVMFDLQFALHELIELVHVDVRKDLRRQVADRYASSLKQIWSACRKALDNLMHQSHDLLVLDLCAENPEQRIVVDGVEELPHVALERVARARVVATYGAYDLCNPSHALVCSFAKATGKRRRNECRFENGIEHAEDGMVKHTVTNRRFMNPAHFWIMDPEAFVWSMSVRAVLQISVQTEDVLLDVYPEFRHVRLVPLIAPKYLPRTKQRLRRDY